MADKYLAKPYTDKPRVLLALSWTTERELTREKQELIPYTWWPQKNPENSESSEKSEQEIRKSNDFVGR